MFYCAPSKEMQRPERCDVCNHSQYRSQFWSIQKIPQRATKLRVLNFIDDLTALIELQIRWPFTTQPWRIQNSSLINIVQIRPLQIFIESYTPKKLNSEHTFIRFPFSDYFISYTESTSLLWSEGNREKNRPHVTTFILWSTPSVLLLFALLWLPVPVATQLKARATRTRVNYSTKNTTWPKFS